MFGKVTNRMGADFVKFFTSGGFITFAKVVAGTIAVISFWFGVAALFDFGEKSTGVAAFGAYLTFFGIFWYFYTKDTIKHEEKWAEIDRKHEERKKRNAESN